MYAHVTARLCPIRRGDIVVKPVSESEIDDAIGFVGEDAVTLTLEDNGEYGDGILCSITLDGRTSKELVWMRLTVDGAKAIAEALRNILALREIERIELERRRANTPAQNA